MSEHYDGPRCFIPPETHVAPNEQGTTPFVTDCVPTDDGHQLVTSELKRGWHYSTKIISVPRLVQDDAGIVTIEMVDEEVPDQPLHLNDDAADEKDWFYELADDTHTSWVEKHGHGNLKGGGVVG